MSYLELALKAKKQAGEADHGVPVERGDCETSAISEVRVSDPYGDRLRAALDSVCKPDYRAGMLPWLAENRPDLHRLLVVGIPDTRNCPRFS